MSQVFNFIVDSLKIAGAPYNIINNELIMAQCQVQVPRTFFTPAHIETLNLQIVCHPDHLAKYPGSELVTKGSYRLQWFVDGIKKRGLIFKGSVPYELDHRKIERQINNLLKEAPRFFYKQPLLYYQPNLLVNFKIGFETDEKTEELYSLSINLVTGEIASNLLNELSNKRVVTTLPKKHLEKRKIPYSEGFKALSNHLKWLLQNHDDQWIENAKLRWQEEVNYLEEFYRGEPKEDLHAFYRQIAEIYRKYRPIIRIEIINAAILYLPIVIYTLESWEANKVLNPIIYDPVKQKIRWNGQ